MRKDSGTNIGNEPEMLAGTRCKFKPPAAGVSARRRKELPAYPALPASNLKPSELSESCPGNIYAKFASSKPKSIAQCYALALPRLRTHPTAPAQNRSATWLSRTGS
eukprot:7433930-Pyramimonas_sp.AAC.1